MLAQASLKAVLILNVLAAPAPLQPALRWRLKEGDVFYHESVASTRLSTTSAGRKTDRDLEQTTLTRYTVKQKNADGSIVLEQTIVSVTGKGGPAAQMNAFEKLKGATFLATLNARGEVTALKGYDQLLAQIGTDRLGRSLVTSRYSEAAIKQDLHDLFACLPGKTVSIGETWRRSHVHSLGRTANFTGETTYRHEGRARVGDKSLERITWTATARYSPPQRGDTGPIRPVKTSYRVDEVRGAMLFDPATGRVVETTSSVKYKGKLTLRRGEEDVEIETEQNIQTKARLLDKAP